MCKATWWRFKVATGCLFAFFTFQILFTHSLLDVSTWVINFMSFSLPNNWLTLQKYVFLKWTKFPTRRIGSRAVWQTRIEIETTTRWERRKRIKNENISSGRNRWKFYTIKYWRKMRNKRAKKKTFNIVDGRSLKEKSSIHIIITLDDSIHAKVYMWWWFSISSLFVAQWIENLHIIYIFN